MSDDQNNPNAMHELKTSEPTESVVRSMPWLGSTVGEEESWAILADGKIMDIGSFADGCVEAVANRIGMGLQKTRDFMEQNGWLLVRIQTTHKIVAVLQTQNAKVLPNGESSDSESEARRGKDVTD